ncbi:5'-deoxynucleotidase hdd1 [Physcomitrium patens]|uniref:5'-deoxynucleotidase n=1 Tax=Physcomitrium patens TaxID=3218 RepID=A0A7I4BJX3_PHYPA|nr:HD domain-containing protein C4G3.17-like isoform X1 [Physcomitrium patens]|eukprot:XP_024402120.1 HD domain-containing protein C4G3.17-like isoform X1 [Physcomitrella patens]
MGLLLPGGAVLLVRMPLAASLSSSCSSWHRRIPHLRVSSPSSFPSSYEGLSSSSSSSSSVPAAPLLRSGVAAGLASSLPVSRWFLRGFSTLKFENGAGAAVSAMNSLGSDGATAFENNSSVSLSPASAIQFLTLIQRLKTTKRTGWVNHGVKDSESIADHMYRMAVMAIISGDLPGVNKDRCVKMAVVHDIAEAIVGDITPNDNVPKEEKNRLESAAIDEMCQLLEGGMGGEENLDLVKLELCHEENKYGNIARYADEVRELWQEYENNSTPEAKFVKDLDKLEMILQAVEYEKEQDKVLDDFFQSTKGKFQTDLGKAWAAEIVKRRPKVT